MLPSQKKKLRAERAAMQPQYDPNDPDAIIPVQEDMIEAAPGEQPVYAVKIVPIFLPTSSDSILAKICECSFLKCVRPNFNGVVINDPLFFGLHASLAVSADGTILFSIVTYLLITCVPISFACRDYYRFILLFFY